MCFKTSRTYNWIFRKIWFQVSLCEKYFVILLLCWIWIIEYSFPSTIPIHTRILRFFRPVLYVRQIFNPKSFVMPRINEQKDVNPYNLSRNRLSGPMQVPIYEERSRRNRNIIFFSRVHPTDFHIWKGHLNFRREQITDQ